MYRYFLDGVVHPERAQIQDHRITAKFGHVASSVDAKADIRILLNQIAVWVETEVEWNALDLRNVVKNLVQLEMDMMGYVLGLTYDVEIRRAICPEIGVDVVFGINVPCISELHRGVDLDTRIAAIRPKLLGESGIFLHRCLRDLMTALKEPDDVAFHCYRAIESLRHHCIVTHSVDPKDKATQWNTLRQIAGCDESSTRLLEKAAQATRHGEPEAVPEVDAVKLLTTAWTIADGYILNC
ncbi:hypothetical protein ACI2S3_07585 [Ralstonia nicotianae]|uniref:hypothetical protein n=1 Tax=Ralstonia pseudosolanacearum TaxID=1310165 RepID=UPI000E588B44|nr:hypothetical protein [Ralstonia pseudosolanacearum]AXV73560.1 hypothetical protein CJO75_07845 [Ralstonia solanacearum]AXW14860.1 hypothetical protein CJO84_07785 [Ralstonia solanacearum]AXW38235.1 hypothetical protein CJO89_07910 [Ralstonia solanacearum]AXW71084.1 hypothetical protein CJO96_07900 [Ralstonia solanacearum]MDO3535121.1 hypothetical protein [Ralstonia pseudosolanacearum]